MSRSRARSIVTSSPPRRILPPVGSSSPAIILQRRRLAAAGRAEHDEELAVVDDEVGILDRDERSEFLPQVLDPISAIAYSGNFETMMNIAVPNSIVTNDQV